MHKLFIFVILFISSTSNYAELVGSVENTPIVQSHAKAKSSANKENEIIQQEAAKKKTIEYYEKRKQQSVDIKRDFERRIVRNWDVPEGSTGKTAKVLTVLNDDGTINSITFDSNDQVFNKSIQQAIQNSAPFPLPTDYTLKQMSKKFTSTFNAK